MVTQPHLPTLPNPAFAGKTGNGDWADMLAEMDFNVGQMLGAVDRLGIRDSTIVIFDSDNGPEFVRPWDGWAGLWRGQYFTAWVGGIRVPFMICWPGRVPAGRVSDAIVHGGDLFRTQSNLWLGKTETCREGVLIYCADRLQTVKWRNYKVNFYQAYDPGPWLASIQGGELSNGHLDCRCGRGRARHRAVAFVRHLLHPSGEGARTHLVHLVEAARSLGHWPGLWWTPIDPASRRRWAGGSVLIETSGVPA